MPIEVIKGKNVPINLWAPVREVESQAIDQLKHIAALPWIAHLAVMPDCLDEDTEVLQPDGWQHIRDLKLGEDIVGFDPETRLCKIEPCTGLIVRELRADEQVLEFTYPFHNVYTRSIRVTDSHRMALAARMGIEAKNIANTVIGDYVWHGEGFQRQKPSAFDDYTLDEFRLFAWILGDGNIKITHNARSDNHRIRFGLMKSRKINRLTTLLDKLALTYHQSKDDRDQTVIVVNTQSSERYLEGLRYSKKAPWNMLASDPLKVRAFLDEAVHIDGDYEKHATSGTWRFNTSDRNIADFFAALIVTTLSATAVYSREVTTTYGDAEMFIVSAVSDLSKNNPSGLPNRKVSIKPVAYNKRVVCLACPSTFFVARQGKTVFITGNCHFGIGATVGSVVAMRGAVSPAAVGVDIGCGMSALKTSLIAKKLPDSLKDLRNELEVAIPVGPGDHAARTFDVRDSLPDSTKHEIAQLMGRFKDLTGKVQDIETRAIRQIGTLGSGNHFIELCLDENDSVWLMLHSGSRNIGKTLAEHHMAIAKTLKHNEALEDRELAVFLADTPEMTAYRHDLYWAQEYARINRMVMLDLYKEVLRGFWPSVTFEEGIYCHHNYVAEEQHFGENLCVTRKGAIRAGRGDLGIIPGSMGTKSFIVRGKGNPDALESASHGAGRKMSRAKAKSKFTVDDLIEATKGVECRKDHGVLDEIPMAYKPIDHVMQNQQDLVEIVATLKQVLCVKG